MVNNISRMLQATGKNYPNANRCKVYTYICIFIIRKIDITFLKVNDTIGGLKQLI